MLDSGLNVAKGEAEQYASSIMWYDLARPETVSSGRDNQVQNQAYSTITDSIRSMQIQ